jgi:hypothetical protein
MKISYVSHPSVRSVSPTEQIRQASASIYGHESDSDVLNWIENVVDDCSSESLYGQAVRETSPALFLSVPVTPEQPHDSFEDRIALDPFHHQYVLQSLHDTSSLQQANRRFVAQVSRSMA